ncbi:unnamed protein product [Cochlearia groenlandica]
MLELPFASDPKNSCNQRRDGHAILEHNCRGDMTDLFEDPSLRDGLVGKRFRATSQTENLCLGIPPEN